MTFLLMRQHVAACQWHARQAVLEAPTRGDVPGPVLSIALADPEELQVDDGYVAEQGHAEYHVGPGDAP